MDYKVGLLGRIALLAGSLFFLAYTIIDEWGVFMISLFIIMVIIQIIFLLRYSESSFKKVRTFLDNIKQDKYSQVYPVKFDAFSDNDFDL